MFTDLLPFLALPILAAVSLFALFAPAQHEALVPRICEGAAIVVFLLAAIAAFVMGTRAYVGAPIALEADLLFLTFRLDTIGVIMFCLVGFVGWIVLRFSVTYLDGETGRSRFLGWMVATLGSVLLLVQAGDLVGFAIAWVSTSLCLHNLLVFYGTRVKAVRAARKKFVIARLGDAALLGAFVLLAFGYETISIQGILELAREGVSSVTVLVPATLLAIAALLKSAQFPAHGWLTEVMEAPTPVSAILHAGVINAGGFLLIRFADVMMLAPGVLAALVMIGGFTALLGSLVMLTQPAIKTQLAWSTIAQMGFMIMQCGLALFPLALLHIVAHSLYKAYAFLSSGGAVEAVVALRRPGPIAIPSASAVWRSFGLALGLYALAAIVFGFDGKPPQAIALGAMLIFGTAYLVAQGMADAAPRVLTRYTLIYAGAASISYFALQSVSEWLTVGVLPVTPAPGPLEWAMLALAVLGFGVVAIAQAMFPLWANHPATAGLRVHLSNGLYANAVFDRMIGNWSLERSDKS